MNRFYCILLLDGGTGISPYFRFCTELWTEPSDCLCWNMFSHGLNYGIEYVF